MVLLMLLGHLNFVEKSAGEAKQIIPKHFGVLPRCTQQLACGGASGHCHETLALDSFLVIELVLDYSSFLLVLLPNLAWEY